MMNPIRARGGTQSFPDEITPDMALQRLDGMINAKSAWLEAHASTRPEWEVGLYRLDREVLTRVRGWLASGIEKREQRHEAQKLSGSI